MDFRGLVCCFMDFGEFFEYLRSFIEICNFLGVGNDVIQNFEFTATCNAKLFQYPVAMIYFPFFTQFNRKTRLRTRCLLLIITDTKKTVIIHNVSHRKFNMFRN